MVYVQKKYIKYLAFLVVIVVGYLYPGLSVQPVGTKTPVVRRSAVSNKPTNSSISKMSSTSALYRVLYVIDGDTLTIDMSGKKEIVRLIGIDTPEVVDPRKSVQCFGKEASEKAKELLTGKMVVLQNDPTQGERDKYKRLLRYAFLENGTNVNLYMIAQGYAHEYTYQSKPYQFQNSFKEAELTAREQKRGLWADGVCL